MKLFLKAFFKLSWYLRLFLTFMGMKRNYKIDKLLIKINYAHRLPDYQILFPYYDRFLPHFVKYLPEDKVIIDVGANIGDTLAGMASNNDLLNYICIEADYGFFKELQKNVDYLKKQSSKLKITIINQFVGLEINNVSMSGSGGSKKAILGGGGY